MTRVHTSAGKGSIGRAAVQAEFDAKAPDYETNRLAEWYKAQGRWALGQVAEVHGPVLDVGCGTGWLLRELLRRFPGGRGIGLDLSPRMVEVATRLAEGEGHEGLSFVSGDWEDDDTVARVRKALSSPASLVFCVSAFHYFADPERALTRMADTLGPGGRLLLVDRAMDRSPMTAVWDRLHRWLIRDGTRFYRTDELSALLRSSGFRSVEVVGRMNRLFWKGKVHTSLVLLSARTP